MLDFWGLPERTTAAAYRTFLVAAANQAQEVRAWVKPGSRLEGLLRYDVLYQDNDNKDGGCISETNLGLPDHACFAKDWTVGLTWKVTPQIMLRAEYHNVNGTGWLTRSDNPDPTETRKYWNLFAIQAAFRF